MKKLILATIILALPFFVQADTNNSFIAAMKPRTIFSIEKMRTIDSIEKIMNAGKKATYLPDVERALAQLYSGEFTRGLWYKYIQGIDGVRILLNRAILLASTEDELNWIGLHMDALIKRIKRINPLNSSFKNRMSDINKSISDMDAAYAKKQKKIKSSKKVNK